MLQSLLLAAVLSQSPVDPAELGPKVGDPLPEFVLRDQRGHERRFADLTGPNGLMLVFFRSADW